MKEKKHPESFWSTIPRRVDGHEFQWGRAMCMEITGAGECQGRQGIQERNFEDIVSSVLIR